MCYWHGTLFYQVMNRNLFSFVNTMGLTAAREKRKKWIVVMMGVVIRRRRRKRSNHPQCVYMVGIHFPEIILNKKSVIDET